jgi:hypothetical protein
VAAALPRHHEAPLLTMGKLHAVMWQGLFPGCLGLLSPWHWGVEIWMDGHMLLSTQLDASPRVLKQQRAAAVAMGCGNGAYALVCEPLAPCDAVSVPPPISCSRLADMVEGGIKAGVNHACRHG